MIIANPIYDVVFRYLMADNKVAKLLLSAIIGEEVIDLVFNPTEFSAKLGNSLTVTRMDFSARIKQQDNKEKVILIELQKSKYFFQIMRFRKYLGGQYSNPANTRIVTNKKGESTTLALPILPIYILGTSFTLKKIPVIRVNRKYMDVALKKELEEEHEFIESLTHDGIIIQIPYLKGKRRTDLEQLLEIFDQANAVDTKKHILEINENHYPKRYRDVIRRLQKASAQAKIVNEMELEDEIIEKFNEQEKRIEIANKKVQEERQKAVTAENRFSLSIRALHATENYSVDQLATMFGMDISEIEKIIKG